MPEPEPLKPPKPEGWPLHDIPPRYRRWRLEHFSDQVREQVDAWRQAKIPAQWSLYLHGGTGSKKSSLAAAILVSARERRGRNLGLFVAIYDAASALRDLNSAKRVLKDWMATELLVLDDLGQSRDTPYLREQLLHLLHHRYDHERRTIVTSNKDLNGLARDIDRATASRFQEGIVLDLGDTDARRKEQDLIYDAVKPKGGGE